MAVSRKEKPVELDVIDLKGGATTFWIMGNTPFYFNRMAEKAKRELLLPRGTLTKSQRATKLKHAPLKEYRDSPYARRDGSIGETYLQMVGSAPKRAVAQAALDMPTSVSKAEINRLVSSPAEFVPVFGIPRLAMDVVRQAGISRTPDIRTRARLERWAMRITLHWLEPMLTKKKVGQLVIAAGMMCGLGDWRQEKGGGSYGLFSIVPEDDPELREIVETGGYLAQQEALRDPVCANAESEELLTWYREELERRGINPEEETPEDVEFENAEDATDPTVAIFGAGEENLLAPRRRVGKLPVQENPNGEIV